MARELLYCQCKLNNDNRQQTAWIPTKFARLGKALKIKKNGEWEDGWTVVETGSIKSSEYVVGHERDFLKQRQASDWWRTGKPLVVHRKGKHGKRAIGAR